MILAAGGISECAGDIRLSVPGRALQDNVVSPFDVLAGGESDDLRLVQLPVFIVFDTFHSRARHGEVGGVDQALVFVYLSAIPLQKPHAVFKGELGIGVRIGKLALEFFRHRAEPHSFQGILRMDLRIIVLIQMKVVSHPYFH